MPPEYIDHHNVVTLDAVALANFHMDDLGLRVGDHPPFPFPGAWVFSGRQPVLHLVELDEIPDGTGRVEHLAFRYTW